MQSIRIAIPIAKLLKLLQTGLLNFGLSLSGARLTIGETPNRSLFGETDSSHFTGKQMPLPPPASSIKSSLMYIPSIWMIGRSRSDSSASIYPFARSSDSATNIARSRRLAPPFPSARGISPSGRRTARPNLRVETLISIRFSAHLPSRSSDNAASQFGRVTSPPARMRTRGVRSRHRPHDVAFPDSGPLPSQREPQRGTVLGQRAVASAARPLRVEHGVDVAAACGGETPAETVVATAVRQIEAEIRRSRSPESCCLSG